MPEELVIWTLSTWHSGTWHNTLNAPMTHGSPITFTIDVLRREYRSGETVGGRREKRTAMWDWPWRIEVREGGRREGGREDKLEGEKWRKYKACRLGRTCMSLSMYSYALPFSHPCVGDLHKAAGHLETFYRLALKHKWHTDNGDSLHEIACEHLRRVYTSIAEEVSAYLRYIHLQALLIMTHEMAVPIFRSPAQLMRPGIGQNASCAVGNFTKHGRCGSLVIHVI